MISQITGGSLSVENYLTLLRSHNLTSFTGNADSLQAAGFPLQQLVSNPEIQLLIPSDRLNLFTEVYMYLKDGVWKIENDEIAFSWALTIRTIA